MKLIGAGLRVRPFFCLFFAAASPHQLLVGRRALPATRTGQPRVSCTGIARCVDRASSAILAIVPITPVICRASSLAAMLQRSVTSDIGKAANVSGKIGRAIIFRLRALVLLVNGNSVPR